MVKDKKKNISTIQPPPIKHHIEIEHDSLKYGAGINSADEISSGGVNQAEAGATGNIEQFPNTSVENRYGDKT